MSDCPRRACSEQLMTCVQCTFVGAWSDAAGEKVHAYHFSGCLSLRNALGSED